MNKKTLSIIIVAFIVGLVIGLIGGYILWGNKIVCNKPYIRVGTDCCLDEDENKICDMDEVTTTTSLSPSTTTILKDKYRVVRVTDGDTIVLESSEIVRLLGINAPENDEYYSKEATERLRELVNGREVRLERDIEDRDMYNRLLRYVYVGNMFVNLEIVEGGYAHIYLYNDTIKYKDLLLGGENKAKMAKIGIWSKPIIPCVDCITISNFHYNAEGNDCNNLNDEYVTFKNVCTFSCEMTGWTVKDKASRSPYEFPDFILNPEGTVTLYTGCGTNTKMKLYWCSSGRECDAIWNNEGDTLYLRESNGKLCIDYSYGS